MIKKLIIFAISIIGIFVLSSCGSLIYTTPTYHDYPPSTIVVRPTPPPPPRPHYYKPPKHRPYTPHSHHRRR